MDKNIVRFVSVRRNGRKGFISPAGRKEGPQSSLPCVPALRRLPEAAFFPSGAGACHGPPIGYLRKGAAHSSQGEKGGEPFLPALGRADTVLHVRMAACCRKNTLDRGRRTGVYHGQVPRARYRASYSYSRLHEFGQIHAAQRHAGQRRVPRRKPGHDGTGLPHHS